MIWLSDLLFLALLLRGHERLLTLSQLVGAAVSFSFRVSAHVPAVIDEENKAPDGTGTLRLGISMNPAGLARCNEVRTYGESIGVSVCMCGPAGLVLSFCPQMQWAARTPGSVPLQHPVVLPPPLGIGRQGDVYFGGPLRGPATDMCSPPITTPPMRVEKRKAPDRDMDYESDGHDSDASAEVTPRSQPRAPSATYHRVLLNLPTYSSKYAPGVPVYLIGMVSL